MGGVFLDYYQIGQRIRKYRKAQQLSQEALAAAVNISTTHMSHIETGNTKLSLPVLVDLATALNVHTDDLLFDTPSFSAGSLVGELDHLLRSFTPQQAQIAIDLVKALKISLDKNA